MTKNGAVTMDYVGMDTNDATIASMEPIDTGNVKGTSTVVVPKPKKSKRVSNRGVTKRDLFGTTNLAVIPKNLLITMVLITALSRLRNNRNLWTPQRTKRLLEQHTLYHLTKFDYDDISVQMAQDPTFPLTTGS